MVLLRPDTDTRRPAGPSEGGKVESRARHRSLAGKQHALLAFLCVALVLGETLGLLAAGGGTALALAPQVAALAPWGIFHDERWLFVYAGSWPAVIGGIIGLIAARGLLTAVMIKAAWPTSVPPLSWRKALTRGISSTAVAGILLSPCAALLVAFELAPISDLWLAAVPAALGIALFVHHGTVDCWWLRHPRLRSAGWVLLSFVELTVAGAVMTSAPRAWIPLVAVVAGLADAIAWRGVVRSLARPTRWRLAPVGPIGLVAIVVVVVLGVAAASAPTNAASSPPKAPKGAAATVDPTRATVPVEKNEPRHVLLVSGYGVRWDGHPISLGSGFDVREFSYRGTHHGRPLPYSSSATQAPLPVLLAEFRAQVDAFARHSGGRIDIVGESEGSLLTTLYLLTTPKPPVDHAVLLSPLVRPGRANYPGPGDDGSGLAAGWILRGVANATNALTRLHVSPDSAFIRSLGNHPEALRYAFGCPVKNVRQLAILPLADAVGVPPGALSVVPHESVVALHGTLLADPEVRYTVGQYLKGAGTPDTSNALEKIATSASTAWQAPPRHLRAEPPDAVGCAQATAALKAWLK